MFSEEFRDESLENRKKQIIDFLARNAVDSRTNRPFTPDMLESAIKQAGVRIENKPVEKQINSVTESLKTIIPIKIETKKIKIKIPAQHTGKVYGLIQEYKEKEVKRLKQTVKSKIEQLEKAGDADIIIEYLESKMFLAAKELRFEDAAYLRDKIKDVKKTYRIAT